MGFGMDDATKKKWMIGCGGCLGIVVILGVLGGILAYNGVNGLMQASGKSVKGMFGESYDPAAHGYQAIGVPLPTNKSGIQAMVTLINAEKKQMVMAMDMTATPQELATIKSGDPQKIEGFIKNSQATGASSSQMQGNEINIENTHLSKLGNGKQVPVAYAKFYSRSKGVYTPGTITLVPENGRIVLLLSMDMRNTASDANADFKSAQEGMEADAIGLVNDSALDDRVQTAE